MHMKTAWSQKGIVTTLVLIIYKFAHFAVAHKHTHIVPLMEG